MQPRFSGVDDIAVGSEGETSLRGGHIQLLFFPIPEKIRRGGGSRTCCPILSKVTFPPALAVEQCMTGIVFLRFIVPARACGSQGTSRIDPKVS